MADNVVSVIFNGVDNLSSKTNSIAGSFTELNSMVSLAKQGIAAAQQVYQATIGTTLAYADSVRQLSLVTGMSTEASSKFLEVADKTGVSVSELQMGLKYMAKNGVEPTIEGIAALSDKFLKLKPGIEQDNFLVKNFGRSGMDMALLMSQGSHAIDALSASTNKNLILTRQEVEAARQFDIATKELADSWKGLTVQWGNEAIPALTNVINGMLTVNNATDIAIEKGHTFHTANAMMYDGSLKIAQAYKDDADGLNKYIDALDRAVGRNQKTPSLAATFIPGTTPGTTPGIDSSRVTSTAQEFQKIQTATVHTQEMTAAQEKNAAITSMSKKEVQDLGEKIDKFGAAATSTRLPLNNMNSDMTAADLEALSARMSVNGIITTMAHLNGMTADVYINIHTTGGLGGLGGLGGGSYGTPSAGYAPIKHSASGSDFIVPPGYSKDSYPMFVQSGEHVQVTPAGGSGQSSKVFNNYGEVHFHLDKGADMVGTVDYVGI